MSTTTLVPGDTPLEHIIVTADLAKRSGQNNALEEVAALRDISKQLSQSPQLALQSLVDHAMKLTGADAAGISIAEDGPEGSDPIFRWHATSGTMTPFLNATMPRYFSPCGVVCERNEAVLMREMVNHYTYVGQIGLRLYEVLLVPFFSEGKSIGTVWAVSHGEHKQFSTEDKHSLEAIAEFTSGIVQSYFNVTMLQAAVKELESERSARENFVLALTHDLRNPLTAIKLNLGLIKKDIVQSERSGRIMNRLENGLKKVENMISDLLDANKLNAGQGIPLLKEETELGHMIGDTIYNLNIIHSNRFMFLNETATLKCVCDSQAVRRVIENLADNAIKYGDQEEKIHIRLKKENNFAVISVNNKGEPIPASNLQDLFKQYRRAPDAVSSGQKGWGIGLSLVKGIIEAHHGQVKAESNSDYGTTFSIYLPL